MSQTKGVAHFRRPSAAAPRCTFPPPFTFKYRGSPLGTGAVESAIRRVINLRLKGNGIYWKQENAEAMLVLRAAALTGRWQETMEKVQEAMASDRRRDWQWDAPDIVAELNSGVPIKPPTPQPQFPEQNETIAA